MKSKKILKYLLLLITFVACEKEITRYAEMQAYYQESVNLVQTSLDSISRFSNKVDGFVALHPRAKDDALYPEIEENIRKARIVISMHDGSWDDDIRWEFEFGEDDEQ